MSLFEDIILNEARAIHPQPMVKDKDDATPSVTTANGNQSVNQPEQDSNSQPPDLNSQPSGGGGGGGSAAGGGAGACSSSVRYCSDSQPRTFSTATGAARPVL